jgi:glycosyltransferase involved in cell wall biosynthesis
MTHAAPKVSIVVPVYNGADYLHEAIDSALAQTYPNIEVVVVNDGSKDDGQTERIALSYGEALRYFCKPNGGVASALNRGIAEMSGEFFSWLSHDDLYTKDKIEKEMSVLSRMGRDDVIVYSDYSVFATDPEHDVPVKLKGVPPGHFRHWITVENRLHGCTLLIPRHAFQRVGGFNENLQTTQDYDLWFRMAKHFSFVHTPNILVKARSHPNQGIHQMASVALTECNSLLTNFIHDLSPHELTSATAKSLTESYAEMASSLFDRGFHAAGHVAERLANRGHIARKSVLKRDIRAFGNRLIKLLPENQQLKLKHAIKGALHTVIRGRVAKVENRHEQLERKFSDIYRNNSFGGRLSRSGEGSDLVQTEVIRRELPKIIRELSIRIFLDAPCGDWFWMKEVALGVERYVGVDIVESLIKKNSEQFGTASRRFLCRNLLEDDLPPADLILCRDCLVHLSFEHIRKVLVNFQRSKAKYLLTTTFTATDRNDDLDGRNEFWRTLNFELPPFNFPAPLKLINEHCTEENNLYRDKCLGLWRIDDIRL